MPPSDLSIPCNSLRGWRTLCQLWLPRCDLASGWRRLLDFLLDIFMCGIIGIIGKTPVAPLLLEALSHSASGEFVPSQ
jgi:hypothetical protein